MNSGIELIRTTGAQSCPMPHRMSGGHVLSERELIVLDLLSKGLSNKEAARQLGISPETIKSHMKNIFAKLEVERRAQAVYKALAFGLLPAN